MILTDPNNPPLNRPGVYVLVGASGKVYVGASSNVAKRLKKHELRNAETFEAVPVFYLIEYEPKLLATVEAVYIKIYKSLSPSGYNVRPKLIGHSGSGLVRLRRKMRLVNANSAKREHQASAVAAARAKPEIASRYRAGFESIRVDWLQRMQKVWSDPNRIAKLSASARKRPPRKWINNGNSERLILQNSNVPEGWQLGRCVR